MTTVKSLMLYNVTYPYILGILMYTFLWIYSDIHTANFLCTLLKSKWNHLNYSKYSIQTSIFNSWMSFKTKRAQNSITYFCILFTSCSITALQLQVLTMRIQCMNPRNTIYSVLALLEKSIKVEGYFFR